jgi:hypothetical protein
MKVYVLMYYDYDGCENYGVYSTEEKALLERDALVQKWLALRGYINTPEKVQKYINMWNDQFDAEEHEVV